MEKKQTRKLIDLRSEAGYQVVEEKVNKKQKLAKFAFVEATEIGFSIALPITVGALFGLWLDEKLASHPKMTLSFLFAGIFIAFANLFILVKKFSKKKST